MERVWWPAPAKLNLMLRITGKRADGYHDLQTVFQILDFGDRLAFDLRDDGVVRKINPPPGLTEHNGLATRAARLLQQTCGTAMGVDIHLDKRLPMGGGLGGGSSNAATTLVVLNRLWQCGLDQDQLAELGRQLGADVPVFIRGRSAWGEGVGEVLTPFELPEKRYLVLCPPVHVSTAELFNAPELEREMPAITFADFLNGEHGNAFEPIALKRYPLITKAMAYLKPHGRPQLTGTGACVFCALAEDSDADAALQAMPQTWMSFVARGVNRSPLMQR